MAKLSIHIRTLSPLFPGGMKPYGHFLESSKYIPGSLLRGATAELLLKECSKEDYKDNHSLCPQKNECNFYNLIGDDRKEGILFPNCYPSEGELLSYTLPVTARTCKDYPGFLNVANEKKHGVFDIVLNQIAYEGINTNSPLPYILRIKCSTCGERTDQHTGRYIKPGKNGYKEIKVRTRRVTHAAINRRRETAEEGILYSVETINEEQTFVGTLLIGKNLLKPFKDVLPRITRLGGQQTRGHGRVKIKVREEAINDTVEGRIKEFNKRLREIWQNQSNCAENKIELKEAYFTIDLQSDAILRTPQGVPTIELSAKLLQSQLKKLGVKNTPYLELVRSYVSPTYISGWSVKWGLPKEVSLGTRAGSVFVYKTKKIEELYNPLSLLEARGIGERREEGFGRILVCDSFHLNTEPV